MKNQHGWKNRAGLGCAALLAATGWTTAQEPQPLQFVESGMREIITGYRPHRCSFLVDGDTGTVIRNKDIRGPELAKAIEAALAGRKKAE